MKQILEYVKQFDKVIITGHIRPDGDCYGSAFGLKELLANAFPKKQIKVSLQRSPYLTFIGTPDTVEDDFFPDSLAIVVDVSDADRISEQRILKSKHIILIDHHRNAPSFHFYNHLEPTSPATCQLIYDFYLANKDVLSLNETAAKAIFTGLVTDTGWFRYSGVTDHTFDIAADLYRHGVYPYDIWLNLSRESLNFQRFKGFLLSNLKLTKEGFVYLVIKLADMEAYGVTSEEAYNALGLIDKIDGNIMFGTFIEDTDHIRVNLRSKGPNIVPLANKYNGGGHMMACGCKLKTFDELDVFLKDVDAYILNCE